MNTEELSNRLTQILTGIISGEPNPNIIQGFVQNFIEYYAWDEDEDGPIPGIKLFKDLNIYLERKYCEY